MADETYYTSKEVAERLKVTDRTVRRWISDGSLKVIRLGRSVRIAESDLQRFIEAGRTE
jgi:excisionase family DNA binding protein